MRPWSTVVVLGAAVLLPAGCGGPTQTGAGTPAQPITHAPATTTSTSQHQSGTPKCTSADVQGVFGPADSVVSGTRQRSIIATNKSDHTCTIHGYGGLELHAGGDGAALELTLTREPAPAPATVTLAPGAKAYKKLLWAFPQTDEEAASCAQGAAYAYVTLPDDTKTFEVHPQDGSDDFGDVCGDLKGYAWSATDQTGQG